jgi:hypothetical protein
MTLQELITLAGDRDLSKSYPKADGVYIWDYKLQYKQDFELELVLIPSDSSKAGFKDKVSVQELIDYVLDQSIFTQLEIVGVEGLTIARI